MSAIDLNGQVTMLHRSTTGFFALDPTGKTVVLITSPSHDGEFATRSFAHALTGSVGHHAWDGSSDRGPELVFGGGVDTLGFFRMQFDYVRMNVIGLPKNNARIYFGGVLPLCVTGCRDEDKDGIRVGNP